MEINKKIHKGVDKMRYKVEKKILPIVNINYNHKIDFIFTFRIRNIIDTVMTRVYEES